MFSSRQAYRDKLYPIINHDIIKPNASYLEYLKICTDAGDEYVRRGRDYFVDSNTIPQNEDFLNFPKMLHIDTSIPLALIRCIKNKTDPPDLSTETYKSYTWSYYVAEKYGPNCLAYLFKPRRCSLFILNFKNLWILKEKIIKHLESNALPRLTKEDYNQYCDSTGLGLTEREFRKGDESYMQYFYANKEPTKVRLIDSGVSVRYGFATYNRIFSVLLAKIFNILGIKCDGFIYDPLLMNKDEQLYDYFLYEWNSEIVLFRPDNVLMNPQDWMIQNNIADPDQKIIEIHEKTMNYVADLIFSINKKDDLWLPIKLDLANSNSIVY